MEFVIISSEVLVTMPEAIDMLQRAAISFGGIISVQKAMQISDSGSGLIILAKKDSLLQGTIFLTITEQENGRVLTSVLLGGDNFGDWAGELKDFYYKLAREHDCDEFMLMGRRGFKRYFSELSEVATVFRVILKEQTKTVN